MIQYLTNFHVKSECYGLANGCVNESQIFFVIIYLHIRMSEMILPQSCTLTWYLYTAVALKK